MKSKIFQLKKTAVAIPAILLLLALPGKVMSQGKTPQLNRKLEEIAKPLSTINWLDFKEGTTVNPTTIFTEYKDAFELTENDQMKVIKTEKDQLGFSHYRYQQYYKNYKVTYGEYLVHQQKDGFVKSANGRLITGLNLGNSPSVAEDQALTAAMHFMNASKYLWQNTEMEKELKRMEKNEQATYYPKGELVYAPENIDGNFKTADYKLAWNFKIYSDDPNVTAKSVFVDALTGRVIRSVDIAMNCSGGTGTSAFNGSVSINTELSGGSYRSHNDCQSTDIYVYNCNRGTAATTFYTDADNSWTLASQQSAVQAQWGAMMTYSYYLGEHSRTSWNNAAGDMIAYNNAVYGSTPTANNACWGCFGNATIFGAGNTTAATDDWNTDDIMGHEFTHGVTQSSANLDYNKESGGLNESFSDIFGEMVESWSEGVCDYLVGQDRGAIRSFINPKSYGQPDTYLGTNWYSTTSCSPTGTNDNCGVHTNSGVQNHWFYLLSEGGSGTNDFGTSYNVTGITRFKARLIAYRALTNYLTSSSQYIDARRASLEAALDLYGQCSQEIIAVGDAWHAVGVESQSAQYVNTVCGVVPAGSFKQAISVLIGGNGCSNTIATGSAITYYAARDRVSLYPGFTAPAGSRFIAYLEPCSSTMYRQGESDAMMSDPEKGIKTPVLETAPDLPVTKATDGIVVSPNPFHSTFDVSISSKQDEKASITIYNSLGVKVREKQNVNLIKGFTKTTFNCSDLVSGIYIVEIYMGEVRTVKKIIKL